MAKSAEIKKPGSCDLVT